MNNTEPERKDKMPIPPRTPEEHALVEQWQNSNTLRAPKFKTEHPKGHNGEWSPKTDDLPLWAATLAKVMGINDSDLMAHLLNQVSAVYWNAHNPHTSNISIAAIQEIAPRDGLEAMLAVQMVAVHNTAIEMLCRTLLKEQTPEGVDRGVNRAAKLMRTFTAQMEALNRYRGKGQQKVTVEHVHVHNGGQAIVGAVSKTAGGGGDVKKNGE